MILVDLMSVREPLVRHVKIIDQIAPAMAINLKPDSQIEFIGARGMALFAKPKRSKNASAIIG